MSVPFSAGEVTYARGQRVRDVDAVQRRLLGALQQVVDAVRVDGRLEVVEELVLVAAQRPQELPLLVLGLDVRLALGPGEGEMEIAELEAEKCSPCNLQDITPSSAIQNAAAKCQFKETGARRGRVRNE